MEKSEIVLPMERLPVRAKNPKNLIIFSKPKVGKTSLVAELEDSLILDLEDGSDYISGRVLKASSLEDIKKIGDAIIKANKPYKYIIIDTITKLEEIALVYAETLYSNTLVGKNWLSRGKIEYGSLLNLPNGSGYGYLRVAFGKIMVYINTLSDNIILLGHVKDKVIDKAGAEFTSLDIDLTGKLSRIIAADSDAVGYLYRKNKSQNFLSFMTSDDITCGSRSAHLSNKDVLISELKMIDDEEKLITYWDNIYIK